MRNNRGITLISLIAYIILATIVIGMLTTISMHFKNNLSDVTEASAKHTEFDKLNVQLLKETKIEDNLIDVEQTTTNKVVFSSGNTYSYASSDKIVYLNNNIKIAENISSCTFAVTEEDNRQKLIATVEIDGIERITEYQGTRIKADEEIYLTVTVESGITQATITANATSTTGNTLYYTLIANGQTYEKSTTNVWNVLGLEEYKEYSYVVIASNADETSTDRKEGTFWTKCSGSTGTCTAATQCYLINGTSRCGTCNGTGISGACTGSWEQTGSLASFACICGDTCNFNILRCYTCGATWYSGCVRAVCVANGTTCRPSGQSNYIMPGPHRCLTCGGSGSITYTNYCSLHPTLNYTHYYCSQHNYVGTSSTHGGTTCKCGGAGVH